MILCSWNMWVGACFLQFWNLKQWCLWCCYFIGIFSWLSGIPIIVCFSSGLLLLSFVVICLFTLRLFFILCFLEVTCNSFLSSLIWSSLAVTVLVSPSNDFFILPTVLSLRHFSLIILYFCSYIFFYFIVSMFYYFFELTNHLKHFKHLILERLYR